MSFFTAPFALLWKHRGLLRQTTGSDIRARYAGSVLGLLWLVLYPLLFLGMYATVYLVIFNIRFPNLSSYEYVAVVFCGLIPFLAFSEALGMGTASVTANASLVKNTLFPIDLVPVKAVFTAQCLQVVGTAMLLVAVVAMGKATVWLALLPVVWVCQLLFTIGVVWILSSLNVYLRDLQNVVAVLTLMLMMISPIAYTPEMIPANLRPALMGNPLYYMIVSYQDCLMHGRLPRNNVLWVLLALSLTVFLVGYWFFARMKRVFADNV